MARLCTIYALSDPRLERVFENVRYVGKTEQDLQKRLWRHISHKSNCYRRSWFLSLKADGIQPVIWPLAFCSNETWVEVEKRWIAKLRPIARLTNLTDGGDGQHGRFWTPEQKARHSALKKSRPMSREMLAKVCAANSAANKGRTKKPWSDEMKQHFSKTRLALKIPATNRIPIVCVETSEEFPSITAAAMNFGVSGKAMQAAVKNGGRCAEFHWNKICHAQL